MSVTNAMIAEWELASEILRIRSLLREQRFADALAASNAVLTDKPENRDALLFAAAAQRYLGRPSEGLVTLTTLERHFPMFSRLYEERGQCHALLRQAPPAIDAFLRAVNLNHALPASWRMLEGLYRMTGQFEQAQAAAGHVAALKNLPPAVVSATALFMDGELEVAETMVRAYLLEHGDHIEAMRLLARIGIKRRVFDDAEMLLAAVLTLAPDYAAARQEYAGVLVDVHKHAKAREQLEILRAEQPGNPVFKTLYAASAVGLGEHEQAIALYKELLRGTPDDAEVHLSIAHALKTLGRTQEAVESYRRAAASRPNFGDAYWSLANLKTYRFTDGELAQLRAAETLPEARPVDRWHVSFALGKALEDRGDYAESFRYYETGNRLKRAESRYTPEIIETNTRLQIATCTTEFFAARRNAGAAQPDAIFIVGLPRSGSTLLEQILASHSQVEGTQELSNVQHVVHQLRGREPDANDPRYPRILTTISDAQFRELGECYLADTSVFRKSGAPFFIDKMPNNFRHIGLIHLMLPNAKIIDARREPMACCFSNLKQLFANGQEFTYSVDDIARYYRTYLELMRHWQRVLPGRILRVQHEDVVDDLEGNVRRVLKFCGLQFERGCIEFHRNQRSVRTASSEQVRQPIYRQGLEQWKHFEAWLAPLEAALGDALLRYRDE